MFHEQLPLPVPCYDLALLTEPALAPLAGHFGHSQLAWLDGRWVQDSGTYSPWRGWFTVTSDSSFMRSSCRPQSELSEFLMGLAPPYGLATHCTRIVPRVRPRASEPCWFGVILTFLRVIRGSPLWQLKHRVRVAQVMASKHAPQGTCWRPYASFITKSMDYTISQIFGNQRIMED